MTMSADMLRRLQADDARLRQTETREVPGNIPGFTSFYATGTWTPAFQGTAIAGTFTYPASSQIGVWTRIGNQVFVHGYVQISAIAVAPTGSMQITGLPFTAANALVDSSLAIGLMDNINTSAGIVNFMAMVRLNTTVVWLSESFDNAAWARYPAANFTNAAAGMELSGSYQV